MELEKRIADLSESGRLLNQFTSEEWSLPGSSIQSIFELQRLAHVKNNWFEPRMVMNMLNEVVLMLSHDALVSWTNAYDFKNNSPKNVGIIMAGNIPMVGFHDLLSVLVSGHSAWIKLSSKDDVLIPFWLEILYQVNPQWREYIAIKETRMKGMDAVIATGSDNSAKYFDYYFGKYPHIIRNNRTSVAVLTGKESEIELKALANDMLMYFGLGCRNVSKLYLPADFKVDRIFENVLEWDWMVDNQKYFNNYQYNRTVYLLNDEKFLDNNFLMLKQEKSLISPVSVINYERYSSTDELNQLLGQERNNIQCIVGNGFIPFGKSQSPGLKDYADGVDVLQFLSSL